MSNAIKYMSTTTPGLAQCQTCGAVVWMENNGHAIHTEWHNTMGHRVVATLETYERLRASYPAGSL